jgi:hypothetical protein
VPIEELSWNTIQKYVIGQGVSTLPVLIPVGKMFWAAQDEQENPEHNI